MRFASVLPLLAHQTAFSLVILALLALGSVLITAVLGQQWISLKRARTASDRFLQKATGVRDPLRLVGLARQEPQSPHASLLLTLLGLADGDLPDEEALESALAREVGSLAGLSFIFPACAGASPLVGLIGTVLGLIAAFHSLGGASGGIGAVAAPAGEALIATLGGLCCAIPSYLAAHWSSHALLGWTEELRAYGARVLKLSQAPRQG